MGTFIVAAIVVALIALAIRYVVRSRKKGGCAGCEGCAGCGGGCGARKQQEG